MDSFKNSMLLKLQFPPPKTYCIEVCYDILQDDAKTAALVEIALSDIRKANYHACWILNNLSKMKGNLLYKHIDSYILKLDKTNNDSQLAGILVVLYNCKYDINKLSSKIDFIPFFPLKTKASSSFRPF